MDPLQSHETFDPFEAVSLTPALARQAYPLVRMADPSLSIGQWLTFARRQMRITARRGGIVALRDRRQCIHALFTYRVDNNLKLRRFLRISDVMVGHLPGVRPLDAVMKAARRQAATLGCNCIVLETLARDEPETAAQDISLPFGFLHQPQGLVSENRH